MKKQLGTTTVNQTLLSRCVFKTVVKRFSIDLAVDFYPINSDDVINGVQAGEQRKAVMKAVSTRGRL